jgi:hypothetical protein
LIDLNLAVVVSNIRYELPVLINSKSMVIEADLIGLAIIDGFTAEKIKIGHNMMKIRANPKRTPLTAFSQVCLLLT